MPSLIGDLLITNAEVLTMDPAAPRGRTIVIDNGRITAVTDDDVAAGGRPVLDAGGATVVPGFQDAHNHMAWYGLSLGELPLGAPPVGSLDELYDAVAREARRTSPDTWIVGSGYDQTKIGGHPTRDGLDRAAPGRRVWIKHTSGHMCVVSSPILEELGIAERPAQVSGGLVATDAEGRPTGLLEERAQSLVNDLVVPYPTSVLVDAIERAGCAYLAEGITSCVEAGVGGGWIGKSPIEVAAYQEAYETHRLPVRVQLMVASDVLHPVVAHPDDAVTVGLDLGIRTGFGDDWLSIGPMKVFTDGSLVGHTAALSECFHDLPDQAGYLQDDPSRLTTLIVDAHLAGWQVAAHAIGDRAIDLVLDAYTTAQRRRRRPDVRHRIEHFGVARPDQVTRAAELGVAPVPQGRFVHELGDGMIDALGPDRARWCYRQRSLLDAGLTLPGSSDRPVVEGAPILGIHDLVNRRTAAGVVLEETEALTAGQALYAYTMGSAYAARRENVTGSITPGKLADLTVLGDDPLTVAKERIRDIEVVATVVEGRVAYSSGQ